MVFGKFLKRFRRHFSYSQKFVINGVTYYSLDEMPDDVRTKVNAITREHFAEAPPEGSRQTTYQFNGQTYSSIEEMPPEAQCFFRDEDHNGIPDVFER